VLEADPKLYSPSRGGGRLIEANVVFPEFIDLEAMLPGEPGGRRGRAGRAERGPAEAVGVVPSGDQRVAATDGDGGLGPPDEPGGERGTGPRASGDKNSAPS
jgi:hypothetical protein